MCDVCLNVDDTVALTALIRALVWAACMREASYDAPYLCSSEEILRAAVWRAARYGIDEDLVDPESCRPRPARVVVARLLDYLRPGLEAHDDWPLVERLMGRILDRRTGAAWQRRTAAEIDGPDMVRRMCHLTVQTEG